VVALKGLFAAVVIVVAAPLVPGLPDLSPPGENPQPPPEQKPAPPPPPSDRAEKTCDRMVAPWGSDSASGKPREPFRTPGRLVASLHAGWTGCLRVGTYTEREVTISKRKVTLRSAPGEHATWRGRIVVQGRRDRLIGLVLDGSAGPRCADRGCGTLPSPTINAPEVVVAENDITDDRTGICVHARSWRRQVPDRFVISRNRIHDCGQRPPTSQHHGIYIADGRDGVIRNNVVYANADRGIQLYPNARHTTVERNTVDGNGSGVIFSDESAGNVVRDNVFSNAVVRWNAESWRLSGRGNRFVENCVRPGNPDPGYNENGGVKLPRIVAQAGNVGAADDPYRDRAGGDFRLAEGSVCAGKGATESVAAP
jgi:parallel beta-helix repeat protein